MKYFKRLRQYKASNVKFDCTTQVSTSYDWWLVTRRVKGQMLFNWYSYSSSTRKHQHKLCSLLRELGIKIDLEIQSPRGLQDLEGAITYHQGIINEMQTAILNPRSRKETNKGRLEQILTNKKIIDKLKELIA